MPLGRVCSRRMATIDPDGTVEEAALQMARLGVDTLVVVEGDGTAAGVVTDRDLVIRCLARSLSPRETFVGEIMTSPPPPGIQLQFLDLTMGRRPGREPLVVQGEYETLPSLLALDDALSMVNRELARCGGSGGEAASTPRSLQRDSGEPDGGATLEEASIEKLDAMPRGDAYAPGDGTLAGDRRERRRRPRRGPMGRPPRAWE
jgi:hypothetical protein